MALLFNFQDSDLKKKMDKMSTKLGVAILMYASTQAQVLEAYMKSNRPWRDRTFAAKNRLNTKVSRPNSDTIRITLAHGVEYGIWLELAHEKKYAIILPTLNLQGPKVIEGMNNLLNQIKF